MHYINAMGGTSLPVEMTLPMKFGAFAWLGTWITAAHIAGLENWEADRESRLFNDRTEWTLKKSVFYQIANKWGVPEIDLFASRINTQLPRFVSWKPDPESCFVDAFTIDWERLNFYAFPPFCQIHRCLQKIIEDRVLQGVLIVPLCQHRCGGHSYPEC